MRFKQPYSVVRRLTSRGTAIFFYRVYDPDSSKRHEYSTGKTSRAAAKQFCEALLKSGQLIPQTTPKTVVAITFGSYARDWWGDDCPYCTSQTARGHGLSRTYRALNRIRLTNQILPTFGSRLLREITSGEIESWFLGLDAKPRVQNTALQVLRVMLGEAERLQLVDSNPAKRVQPVAESRKVRDLYTPEEVRRLFDDKDAVEIWGGDHKARLAMMLAVNSAMRAGEVLGLQVSALHREVGTNWVGVEHSWDRRELKGTKSGVNRKVPVPEWLLTQLVEQAPGSGYVFSDDKGVTPITYYRLRNSLKTALANIGITEEDQKRRGLGIHAFRHFVNTSLRGKVDDDIIRTMVGHTSQGMTEHYTSRPLEDFKPIMNVIQGVFTGGKGKVAK